MGGAKERLPDQPQISLGLRVRGTLTLLKESFASPFTASLIHLDPVGNKVTVTRFKKGKLPEEKDTILMSERFKLPVILPFILLYEAIRHPLVTSHIIYDREEHRIKVERESGSSGKRTSA